MRRFALSFACIAFAQLALSQPVPAEVVTPAPAVVVELIDAGTTPRRELRFSPIQGAKQVTVMTMKMNQAMTMGGQAIPAQDIPANKITIETTVDQVFDNGDIGFKFSYTDITIEDDPANPSPIAGVLKQTMTPLIGTTGNVVVSNCGLTQKMDMVIPEGVSEQLKKMIEGMKSAMNQISSPVPVEAIGVGGKWSVVQFIDANGMKLKQESIHEVTELSGEGFTMSVTLTQSAEPQEVKNPQMPVGTTINLKSLQSTGSGTSTIKTDSILPSNSVVEINSKTAMSIQAAGQNQDMAMDLKMMMTLAPAE